MHYKVFLDTNIYDESSYSFRNERFNQLREYAALGVLELQINSIVEGEVTRHIIKKVGDKVRDLNKVITSRELKIFRSKEMFASQLEIKDRNLWINVALEEFARLLVCCLNHIDNLNGTKTAKIC